MFKNRALIGAIAAALSMSAAVGMARPAPMVTINAPRRSRQGLFGGYQMSVARLYGRKGAHITMAQQQRASKKARNVKRHKSALKR